MKVRLAFVSVLFGASVALSVPNGTAGTLTVATRDSSSRLAIERVSDTMSETAVTYRVETYDGWDSKSDFSIIRWYFDLKGDGTFTEMCILLEGVGDGRLRAELYPKCGPVVWSTAETRKPAPNVVEFDLQLRDLINGAGVVPGRPLHYRVYTEDARGGHDWAPAGPSAFIVQNPLPRPPGSEYTGPVGNELEAAGQSSGAAGGAGNPPPHGPLSPVGGLPVATVLVTTLAVAGAGYLVWRAAAVHSRDT